VIARTIKNGAKLNAKIVDFNDWPGDPQITPLLEVRRPDGTWVRVRTRYGSGKYAKMRGAEFIAIYQEGADFALIDTWAGRWGSVLVIAIFYVISAFAVVEFALCYFVSK
jgi:hypothetical protein